MFRIGVFSKMNRVTIKTLRYYDEVGLLKPTKVDEWTNYRYYDGKKIGELHRIIALKQIGFSIDEIKKALSKNLSEEELVEFLINKRQEIERLAKEEKQKAERISAYLEVIKKDKKMKHNIILKELPAVIVASMRTTIPDYDEFNNLYPKMGRLMGKHGARCAVPEYCFTIYNDGEYKEKDIDVEVCQAVANKLPDADGVVYKQIEGVPTAACILHKGPYSTIGKSYETLFSWVERNGYEVADDPRESYIDGVWNKEDPADWLTEIQVPVTKQ